MKHLYLLSLSLFFLLTGCNQPKQYYEVTGMLHTPYQIKFEYTESLENEISAELQRYYHCLNPFDSTSVISQVNQNKDIEVDDLFIEVFNKAMEVSRQTNGIYDITCAPFINLWGFGFSKSDSVTPAMIDSIRPFVGYQKVRLEGRKVIKDDPRLLLNCSSLGDGCCCEVIARLFDSKGIENYLIDIGGETTAKGVNPRGECWRVGITKPSDDRWAPIRRYRKSSGYADATALPLPATTATFTSKTERNTPIPSTREQVLPPDSPSSAQPLSPPTV